MSKMQAIIATRTATIDKRLEYLGLDRPTNTYKRQQEQLRRDKEAAHLRQEKEILEYLEAASYVGLTPTEKLLLVGAYYKEMQGYLLCKQNAQERGYEYNPTYPTSTEAADKLKKYGILTTIDLRMAVDAFEEIVRKATIPASPRAQRIKELTFKSRLRQGGDVQFTPTETVRQLMSYADILPGSRVLEPSAGVGGIADEIKAVTPNVDCIEFDYDFRELLDLKGHTLVGTDFLQEFPRPEYDVVLMNPPFSAECRHIRHAYDFLKPGGTLVSVCSSRMEHPKGRTYEDFYMWLVGLKYQFRQVQTSFEATKASAQVLVIGK